MIVEAINGAIDRVVNQGRRSIKVKVEEGENGTVIITGTTKTYYEKQLVVEAAKAAAGKAQICTKGVEVI